MQYNSPSYIPMYIVGGLFGFALIFFFLWIIIDSINLILNNVEIRGNPYFQNSVTDDNIDTFDSISCMENTVISDHKEQNKLKGISRVGYFNPLIARTDAGRYPC